MSLYYQMLKSGLSDVCGMTKSGDPLPMAESYEPIRDKYIIYMCYASYGERPLPPAPDTSSLL